MCCCLSQLGVTAKAGLAPARASALCQADGAQPGLQRALGGQCFERKVGSSCEGWVRPPGCSCSPAFLSPHCCWTRCSSGNPRQAKCAGAERGAGLAPSLTLFHIFRNMNCHGYQSLGSSLATFAPDVRLAELFPHSTGRSCSCSRAVPQRGPSLHLQPPPGWGTGNQPGNLAPVWEGTPAPGAWHQCGKAAARPGHRLLSSAHSAAFPQIPIIPCVVGMPCTPHELQEQPSFHFP